jgi:hypothetical protein
MMAIAYGQDRILHMLLLINAVQYVTTPDRPTRDSFGEPTMQ